MNNPHADIIIDLLPLYFAGEASAASRELVDAYFAAHPQFAKAMHAAQSNSVSVPIPAAASATGGTAAVKRIRAQLRWRAALIAIGIFCSISPFTFVFENDQLRYFMWRDAPAMAIAYASVAACAWIALFHLIRRTSTA
jgi:hypothetical protein